MSRKSIVGLMLIVALLLISGCAGEGKGYVSDVKTLRIRWVRLISEGETCQRCGSTEVELEKAISTLGQSLAPMKIEVVLEKHELSLAEFKKDPLRSNQIWINNRPLEDWIGGEAGQSPCCDVCGPADCRTVEVKGEVYEAINADLIIKAGLIAASGMVGKDSSGSCCESQAPSAPGTGCCPK